MNRNERRRTARAAGSRRIWRRLMGGSGHRRFDSGCGVVVVVVGLAEPGAQDPEWLGKAKPVFYKGERWGHPAVGEKEPLRLALADIRRYLDPAIVHEPDSQTVVLTTSGKVVRMRTDQLTAAINDKSVELRFSPVKEGEELYLPIAPIAELYRLKIEESAETGAVKLYRDGDVLQWGKVGGETADPAAVRLLRAGPGNRHPVVREVPEGEEVHLWGERNGWYRVQLVNGVDGYIRKSDVAISRAEKVSVAATENAHVPWKPLGGKIVLTWEHVVNQNPQTGQIGEMPGLNVISPTWFHLQDESGTVTNKADPAYVNWAHSRNLQVWAQFINGFDPERTGKVLATHDRRIHIIRQLLAYAQMYKLQGINLDFENVYLKDKDLYTQFVRELTPLAHEQGLVVSVDVTVKGGSETWLQFYDRPALARIVDYLIVMAYDEHWASSPKAGSVSSLGWTEQKRDQAAARRRRHPAVEADPGRAVLYADLDGAARRERQDEGDVESGGHGNDPQAARGKGLKPAFQPETGQHYVEYREGDTVNKIWIEDVVSMKTRIELVKKYDLAGVAAWRRGFESPDIWTTIRDTLEKRP